jgi:serine/threonine-protein kinase HipA
MMTVLQVATPQGDSGKILTSAGDYLFRYHEDAKAQAAISLLKNKSVPFSSPLFQ